MMLARIIAYSCVLFIMLNMNKVYALDVADQQQNLIRLSVLNADGEVIPASDLQAVVNQRIILALDVLTPTWFVKAPVFPHLTLDDAMTLKLSSFAQNFTETFASVVYAGQRREYSVFAQRAGPFVIDGLSVDVTTALPAGTIVNEKVQTTKAKAVQQTLQQTLRSEPILLQVEPLPIAENQGVFVAEGVQIEQSISPFNQQLQVGDLLDRKLTIKANNTLGSFITPIDWPYAKGLSQSSLRAHVSDKHNRGDFTGQRIETQQYKALASGKWVLPELNLQWWDGRQLQTSVIAAKTIDVSTGGDVAGISPWPLFVLGARQWLKAQSLNKWLYGLLALVISLFLLMFFYKKTAINPLNNVRNEQINRYKKLINSLETLDAASIIRRYYQWRALTIRPHVDFAAGSKGDVLWRQVYALAQNNHVITQQQKADLMNELADITKHDDFINTAEQAALNLPPLNPL